jgi:hypothetical protein
MADGFKVNGVGTDEVPGLVWQLLVASGQENAAIASQLADSYKAQADKASATLYLVREAIHRLFEGPYMPNPRTVENALYPGEEAVRAIVEDRTWERGW